MLILGLDTGGTYTDAVLLDPGARRVVAKAKVFTTKNDLARCIGDCVRALSPGLLGRVSLVCVSTTLATNAVVEGDGGRVGLLVMGSRPEGRLPVAAWRQVDGLLDIKGRALRDINPDQIRGALADFSGKVDAVAVSGFASVRNPAHELAVKHIVRERLDLPVVCAHELSSSLGHYERTVTAVINAGLIPKIAALVAAVRGIVADLRLDAPVMVVKGDGSLVRDDVAASRPIETVLSGPAASVVGGLYLSGVEDALLLDMGGTTTDIALARGGRVGMNMRGATVGGWRTMVRAAEIATHGIGGDSRISLGAEKGELIIGPGRVQPLCVAGALDEGVVRRLEKDAGLPGSELSLATHAVLYRLVARAAVPASRIEQAVATVLQNGPMSIAGLTEAVTAGVSEIPAEDMCRRGILEAISLTPTDLLHASGELNVWNAAASRAVTAMFAGKMGLNAADFVEKARRLVGERLASACVESALQFAGQADAHGPTLRRLVADAFGEGLAENDLLTPSFSLGKPIVAVGAPVAAWLPGVGDFFRTPVVIPRDAEVANAVGAAVGQIRVRFEALVRPDRERAAFTGYSPSGRRDFAEREAAEAWALDTAREQARRRVEGWGGADADISEKVHPRHVIDGDGNAVYIETRITVEATGNPSAIQEKVGE